MMSGLLKLMRRLTIQDTRLISKHRAELILSLTIVQTQEKYHVLDLNPSRFHFLDELNRHRRDTYWASCSDCIMMYNTLKDTT